uniref:C-CAP/cofactor C-like domain-containing protein n=1 Tax=Oryctolagus cuniculus TaxID=9986 RepID=G1TEU8_RABIT
MRKKTPEACKRLPSQLPRLPLPPARAGRCNIPPLRLPHHYLSPHPPHAHSPLPPQRRISGLQGGSREELGGGGGLRVSNLVLINKPTCAAAAAATHPTIPDIRPVPLRRKKSFPRLPPTPPIHKDLCLPARPARRPRPSSPPPFGSLEPIGEGNKAGGLTPSCPANHRARWWEASRRARPEAGRPERKLEVNMESASCSAGAVGDGDMGSQRDLSSVPERLHRREQERQLEVGRRKQKRQDQEVEGEKSDFFAAAFARERAAVEELLEGAAYDLRQGQETMARLQAALAERRQELQPKKRFAFRTRRKEDGGAAAAAAAAATADAAPAAPAASPRPLAEEGPGLGSSWVCGFSHLESQVLEKRAEELHQRDVVLTELNHCTVRLYGNPNTLRLTKARGCTVLCGPVSTSVFLEDCSDCLLAVACQQLRVHTTTDTRVFLHVTSRAIVEYCHGIQFAPYTWSYAGIDADFESSGLDRNRNHWNDVDDFNWLARDVASPNWSILPEGERKVQWD